MGHEDLREIFERLERLEHHSGSRSGSHGDRDRDDHRNGGDRDRRHGRHHDRHDDRHDDRHHDRHDDGPSHRDRRDHGGEFDEKHLIDTIVKLVGERVERGVQDKLARMQRRDDGGDEKRMVDLVVRLVGERVQEIVQRVVSTELDRRFGRPAGERPPGGSDPDVH